MPRTAAQPSEKARKALSRGKKPPTVLALAISGRLRAIQAEMHKTNEQMADMLSVGLSRWTNWVNAENLPQEEVMIDLCEKAAISMDWLYRGDPSRIELGHIIRLTARLKGINPDSATADVLRLTQ